MKIAVMRVEYPSEEKRFAVCSYGTQQEPGKVMIGGEGFTSDDAVEAFQEGVGEQAKVVIKLPGVTKIEDANKRLNSIVLGV